MRNKIIVFLQNGGVEMNKIYLKFGNIIASLALVVATISVNSTCRHYLYQEPIPECAKKLSKIK